MMTVCESGFDLTHTTYSTLPYGLLPATVPGTPSSQAVGPGARAADLPGPKTRGNNGAATYTYARLLLS